MRKLFLSLAGLALIASPAFAGKFNKVITPGDKAPTFSGLPAASGEVVDGKTIAKDTSLSLSDLKDEVVVVVFLGNHCPVVVAYEDRIIDFANDYKNKGVKVVGICSNDMDSDKLPAIKDRIKEKGYNYVYGYDESGAVGKSYGAQVTPQFFVVDKGGVIRYTGAMDDNMNEAKVSRKYLRDAVDAVLKGETVETAETQAKGCGIKYKRN